MVAHHLTTTKFSSIKFRALYAETSVSMTYKSTHQMFGFNEGIPSPFKTTLRMANKL